MPKEKTTKAEYYTMRLNPVTSEEDRATLEIIKAKEKQGYPFKKLAQDAILRYADYTPEMFSKSPSGNILGGLEDLLTRFAHEIVGELRGGGIKSEINGDTDDEDPRQSTTPFARTLARSFMQRQQERVGDEE
jgi:hypothetical protein